MTHSPLNWKSKSFFIIENTISWLWWYLNPFPHSFTHLNIHTISSLWFLNRDPSAYKIQYICPYHYGFKCLCKSLSLSIGYCARILTCWSSLVFLYSALHKTRRLTTSFKKNRQKVDLVTLLLFCVNVLLLPNEAQQQWTSISASLTGIYGNYKDIFLTFNTDLVTARCLLGNWRPRMNLLYR